MAVLTDVALGLGHDVILAADFGSASIPGRSVHLDRFRDVGRVSFVDLSACPECGLGLDLPDFARLVRDVRADITVLAHADNHMRLLSSQITHPALRLPGRTVGVFISSTNYAHLAQLGVTVTDRARYVKRLPRKWKHEPSLFHGVLLPAFRLLDVALCLDEVFVGERGRPYFWMPDIAAPLLPPASGPSRECLKWRERLRPFLARDPQRPVLVYYGTAQARRGYDLLLRLALDEGASFVHAGRQGADEYSVDVAALRAELARRGALFETGEYLEEFDSADMFLRCAHHVVLPYRGHFGSSGVMLQALRAGRPVLVPDLGLMAERVRRFGLGRVFRLGDQRDLRRQHEALSAADPGRFAEGTRRFLSYFTEAQVRASLEHALGVRPDGAVLPGRGGPVERG